MAPLLFSFLFLSTEALLIIPAGEFDVLPRDGAIDVPVDARIIRGADNGVSTILVGPDGPVATNLVEFDAQGIRYFIFTPLAELIPETLYTVLDTDQPTSTFTTGTERAAAPRSPIVIESHIETTPGDLFRYPSYRAAFTVETADDTAFVLVDPEGDSLDNTGTVSGVSNELGQVTAFFAADQNEVTYRLVAVNLAGAFSAPTVHTARRGGGCQGSGVSIFAALGLLAFAHRRRLQPRRHQPGRSMFSVALRLRRTMR